MRMICGFLSAFILLCCLGACAKSAEDQWQEQYDLGVRYLSDGNYEEARYTDWYWGNRSELL